MAFINIQPWRMNKKMGTKPLKICVLILAVLLLACTFGFAEEGDKEELVARIGTIDRMEGVEIVINDCSYDLSPGVRFYTNSKMDTYANRSWFKVGTRVGFHLDDRRDVIAIWFKSK